MDIENTRLKERLEKIGQPPDFTQIFKTSKYPVQTLKSGTMVFREGDSLGKLYFIKKGFVKIFRLSEEGRETTNYLLGPGYVLGVRALLSGDECAKHNAEAMTELSVITITRKQYYDIVATHPEFLVELINVILDRLTYTERKLEGFIFSSTTARIANFLLDIAERFVKKRNGKVVLPLKLTHQRIGEFVGALRETVTLAVHVLESDKVITAEKGKVTIFNMKRLREYALFGRKH